MKSSAHRLWSHSDLTLELLPHFFHNQFFKKIHKHTHTQRSTKGFPCGTVSCILKTVNYTLSPHRGAATLTPLKVYIQGPNKFLFIKTALAALSHRCLFTFAS